MYRGLPGPLDFVPGTQIGIEIAMPEFTTKQQRFVDEYLVDLNATKAAKRAGYSRKSAYSQGHRLLKNAEIQSALTDAMLERSRRTGLSQDWVVEKLIENVRRAMAEVPVLDRQGIETGEYRYNGTVANRALELLGKHQSMFTDKTVVSGNSAELLQAEKVTDLEVARRLGFLLTRGAEPA